MKLILLNMISIAKRSDGSSQRFDENQAKNCI